MPLPEAISNRLIGELFVERGLVSQSQLLVALELQQETGQQLGQILVERFGVERTDLAKVVAEHWARMGEAEDEANTRASESWRQLGEILVDRGFVTREQLVQALERQRQTGERLGEALIGQGVLSKFELAGSLAEQASTVGEEGDAPSEPARVVPLVRPTERPADAPPAERAEAESTAMDQTEAAPARQEPEAEATVEPEHAAAVELESEAPREVESEVMSEPASEATIEPEHAAAVAEELPPDEPARAEHAVAALVAFASTPRGYRLLVLEDGAVPDVGERVELPELGELVVLRRGVSPLPLDERACVFLEQPAPVAHAG